MTSSSFFNTTPRRLFLGFLAGLSVAAVDNFASRGEVSSIVIVAMLVFVTFAAGAAWGSRAWVPSAVAWSCVPLSHVVKHAFHLADTLQPNTYRSILLLAVFTGAIAAVGTGLGIALRRPGP
jgi:hypothetical protein